MDLRLINYFKNSQNQPKHKIKNTDDKVLKSYFSVGICNLNSFIYKARPRGDFYRRYWSYFGLAIEILDPFSLHYIYSIILIFTFFANKKPLNKSAEKTLEVVSCSMLVCFFVGKRRIYEKQSFYYIIFLNIFSFIFCQSVFFSNKLQPYLCFGQ